MLPSAPIGLPAASLLALFQASAVAAPLVDYPTEEEALLSFFPGAEITKELGILVDADKLELRRGRTPRHLFRYVARKDGQLLGFAVVDEVMGKARPITYMLAVDAKREVLGIEVLVYRESHGHEISRAAFRRQFEGKQADSPLKLGDDIRNIAGATISCRAITGGVADLLDMLAAIPALEVQATAPAGAASGKLAREPPTGAAWVRTQVHMNAPLTISRLGVSGGPELERAAWLAATDAAFAEAKRLERLLSLFLESSDVARLNAAAGRKAVEVAPETRAILGAAAALSRRTGGAFDPIAGALTRLIKATGASPKEAARLAARSQCGAQQLELLPDGVRLARRGAAVDLGGSAKGFALDRIAALLATRGITRGVLNFGGQVLVLGQTPELIQSRGGFGAVQLGAASLATSGDDERSIEGAAGTRRSHLVDPRTGALVAPHGTVQVASPSAFEADALATALYVLGPNEGWNLSLELDLAARFEATSGEPERQTPAWKRRFGAKP